MSLGSMGCMVVVQEPRVKKMQYPTVIKPGLLENPPFSLMIFPPENLVLKLKVLMATFDFWRVQYIIIVQNKLLRTTFDVNTIKLIDTQGSNDPYRLVFQQICLNLSGKPPFCNGKLGNLMVILSPSITIHYCMKIYENYHVPVEHTPHKG